MKRIITLALGLLVCLFSFSQTTLFSTGFEGPGFEIGWSKGMSTSINIPPSDYPAGLDPWDMWNIHDPHPQGYVHSGDSAAFIGGTATLEDKYDWLISPQFAVPQNAQTNVFYWMWYHSSNPSYWTWVYLMVYDIDDDSWEMVELILYEQSIALHYVEEYSFDVSAWAGKNIRVAFVKRGTYQFALDDIRCVAEDNVNVAEYNPDEVKAYPNPVSDFLFLENADDAQSISIFDMAGREYTQQVKVAANRVTVDLSSLKSGLYLVKINSGLKDYNTIMIQKK